MKCVLLGAFVGWRIKCKHVYGVTDSKFHILQTETLDAGEAAGPQSGLLIPVLIVCIPATLCRCLKSAFRSPYAGA
jgi:hypothetical protein